VASFRYVVADAFTDTPLQGNQVAVFTDARGIPEELLQPLAREMNYSETVFVLPKEADGHVRVRIFTPGVELPFAGHPILGTAFVLAAPLQLEVIRLETGAGTIPVALERDGDRIVFGWMDQSFPPGAPYPGEAELLAALGVERSELPIESYLNGPEHVYVCLGSKEQVAALGPDLGRLPPLGINCFAGEGRSWKTRLFAPGLGVAEDPATGSAAGPLAVHLARHERIGWGEEIEIEQGTEIQRRSTLFARAVSEGAARVGGSAVVVARGEFRL
jgi:trans-2,3-dihydro-3-hydroxyanthranilate isomerase